jgi:hypothetical protein
MEGSSGWIRNTECTARERERAKKSGKLTAES